jgi:hypothetical protein
MLTFFSEISIAASRAWLAAETTNDGEFYHVNDSGFIVWCSECVADTLELGDLLARTWSLGIFEDFIAAPTIENSFLFEVAAVLAEIRAEQRDANNAQWFKAWNDKAETR